MRLLELQTIEVGVKTTLVTDQLLMRATRDEAAVFTYGEIRVELYNLHDLSIFTYFPTLAKENASSSECERRLSMGSDSLQFSIPALSVALFFSSLSFCDDTFQVESVFTVGNGLGDLGEL